GDDGLEVAADDEAGDLALGPALLGEGDEERGGLADDLGAGALRGDGARIGPGGDGAGGAEDADDAPFGGLHGGARPGLDDAEDGDVELDPEHLEGDGADGIAGDDDALDPAIEEEAGASERVADDGARRARAVRNP